MNLTFGDRVFVNDAFRGVRAMRALASVGDCVMVCPEDEYLTVDRAKAEAGLLGVGAHLRDILSVEPAGDNDDE